MSSNEQAFVTAFARRNRQAETSRQAETPSQMPVRQHSPSAKSGAESLEQEIQRRVARSAPVWSDPDGDQFARADMPVQSVARPHVEPKSIELADADHSSHTAAEDQANALAALMESLQPIDTSQHTMESLPNLHWVQATDVPTSQAVVAKEPVSADANVTQASSPASSQAESQRVDLDRKPSTNTATQFQAAWEVDVFDVPKAVADLFFNESLFQDLSDRMNDAVRGGMRTMLVTSANSGEGRSSVAIGIALAAGASGVRVAIVDADLDEPTLAEDLRLDLEHGWLDTLRSGLSIKEVAVHAVEDAVTLFPLVAPEPGSPVTADEVAQLIETLRDKFDLVVIDGPAGTSANLQPFVSSMDSAIIVRDASRTEAGTIENFARWLTRSGVQGLGMVENFVS